MRLAYPLRDSQMDEEALRFTQSTTDQVESDMFEHRSASERVPPFAKSRYVTVKSNFNHNTLKSSVTPLLSQFWSYPKWHEYAKSAAKDRSLEIRSATPTT